MNKKITEQFVAQFFIINFLAHKNISKNDLKIIQIIMSKNSDSENLEKNGIKQNEILINLNENNFPISIKQSNLSRSLKSLIEKKIIVKDENDDYFVDFY